METHTGVGKHAGAVAGAAPLFGAALLACPRRVPEADPVHHREELFAYDTRVRRWPRLLQQYFVMMLIKSNEAR